MGGSQGFQEAHHFHVLVLGPSLVNICKSRVSYKRIVLLFLSVLPAEKTGSIVILQANTKHLLFSSVI